jgi:flagellar biosynthetic protein FliO
MTNWYYIQSLISFGVIAAFLWVVLKYSKKIQLKKFSNELKVIDRLPLSNQASIVIVKVKDTQYLMSVADNGVTILDKLSDGIGA